MGETVVLYSLTAILSACVAALGFKISDKSKGGISITKMAEDLYKSAVPGFKVILGTAAMALDPGAFYAYMQVVNGKTSVPQNLISWIQNWLSENGAYDNSSIEYPKYVAGKNIVFQNLDFDSILSVFSASGIDTEPFRKIINHFGLTSDGRMYNFIKYYNNGSNYEYTINRYDYSGYTGKDLSPFKVTAFGPSNYFIAKSSKRDTASDYVTNYIYTNGEFKTTSGKFRDSFITFYKGQYASRNAAILSNVGSVRVKGQTGLKAGEKVPGKDVVIPGEGTGTLTNEDIVGWLKSAVGAAVASALGIGTDSIPFVPVAVKNPAITGDITDALDNVIDQAQDIAQAGATDIDTVATGDKYANISLAPSKPSGNISASSLYTIWNPSQAQLNNLASFLWSTDFVDTIKKILQSPMDALISLALFPVKPPTDGNHNILLGYIDSGVSAPRVSDQFMTVQTSGLVVPHKYNSYLDYAPYTKAEIFLPFIGFCPLNINDIMGKSVDVTYNIDLLSGVCTAIVHANAQSLYSYSGNMAMFLPLSAGNWARMLTPIFGMVGGVSSLAAGIGGVMDGAPLLASTGMAVHGAESIGNLGGNSVSRSGSISGNSGIMGDYQPFIVVTRPINDKPATYDSNIGQTYNKSAQLGTLSGFTVIEEAHIEGMTATDAEKKEIERLLKEGVIL